MLLNAQEREEQFIANAKMDQDNWIEERDTMLSQISKLALQADKMSALEMQMDEEREKWEQDRQKLQLRLNKLSTERDEL